MTEPKTPGTRLPAAKSAEKRMFSQARFQDLKANKNWGARFGIESLHGMRDAGCGMPKITIRDYGIERKFWAG